MKVKVQMINRLNFLNKFIQIIYQRTALKMSLLGPQYPEIVQDLQSIFCPSLLIKKPMNSLTSLTIYLRGLMSSTIF